MMVRCVAEFDLRGNTSEAIDFTTVSNKKDVMDWLEELPEGVSISVDWQSHSKLVALWYEER